MLPSSAGSDISPVPFVSRVVILDAALHVLQFVQHGEHVDEFPESEQVRLRDEVLSAFCVAQTTDLSTEAVNGSALELRKKEGGKEK